MTLTDTGSLPDPFIRGFYHLLQFFICTDPPRKRTSGSGDSYGPHAISSMISTVLSIFCARQALLPQNNSPLSTSPVAALINARVMQYGAVFGSQVLMQCLHPVINRSPAATFSRKAFCIALPGIPTGLFTMTISYLRALRYACLYASAASHSSVVTKRVPICTPAAPRSRQCSRSLRS